MKTEVIKQLKIKLVIAILIITIVAGFYGFNTETKITGDAIVDAKNENGCNFSNATYEGNLLEILNPINNSYTNLENLNFSIKTDFYGEDIIINCSGEITLCPMNINLTIKLPNQTTVYSDIINTSKINEGNKIYTFGNKCTADKCKEENYTIKYRIEYACETLELINSESLFMIHNELPTITEIYPLNNSIINISTNATTTIFYKLNATDTIGIANRTISMGTKTISMIQNPTYNETLSPGKYVYTFRATDLAGNTKSLVSTFTIVNSSTNETIPEVNETNETTINATISFDTITTEDNKVTNSSILRVKIIVNSTTNSTNLTFRIYDSANRVVYENSTSQKILDITHNFISDGTYHYNASILAEDILIPTPTRKITIDTEAPSIQIIFPQKNQTSFTNYAILELKTEDTNKVTRTWINDGTKEKEYTGRINETLTAGNYTWTIYAKDEAGNIAKTIFKFSIATETTNSSRVIAIILLIIALILLVILIVLYFLRKNSSNAPPTQTKPVVVPPSNYPRQFNRPLSPAEIPNITSQSNQSIFIKNPYQR